MQTDMLHQNPETTDKTMRTTYDVRILKRRAWRYGRKSATHSHDRRLYINQLKTEIKEYSNQHKLTVESVGEIWKHYRQGVESATIPREAPELALQAACWYRETISSKFRIAERYRGLTKSEKYIFLSHIVYALGTWSDTFLFSLHRIASIGAQYYGKFSTSTVRGFIAFAIKEGFIECVKEGLPYQHYTPSAGGENKIGLNGVSAVYRIVDRTTLIKAFGMDRACVDGDGPTYVSHVDEMRRQLTKAQLSPQFLQCD